MSLIDRAISWLGTGKTGIAFFCLCLSGGVVMIVSALMPYHPLAVKSISVVPAEVCPNEGVEVALERTWQRPSIVYGIEEVEVTSYWVNVETGARYPAITTATKPEFPPFTGRVRSDLVREAPPDSGVYRLETTYQVKGRTLLLSAYQDVPVVRSNDVTVVQNGRECPGAG